MNTDTGHIRALQEGEALKKNEIEVRKPNPLCPRCHGKGSYLADLAHDPNAGNRATRRRLKKARMGMKYLPCPECAGRQV